MKLRIFVQKMLTEGMSQSEIARRAHVSQATINKILHTDTKPTVETLKKFSSAFNLPLSEFIVSEDEPIWEKKRRQLSVKEERVLTLFSQLDERRQDRVIEDLEDRVLAVRESGGRGSPANESPESNSGRKSNG